MVRWYGKAGLAFVFGTGVLFTLGALFGVCGTPPLGMGLTVLASGTLALFANVPWLGGFVRRRVFRAVIGMRRAGCRALAATRRPLVGPVLGSLLVRRTAVASAALFVFFVLGTDLAFAGTGPWVTAVKALCDAFSNQIGKGLALVAVIIAGLMFAFGEGGSKSAIAGLVFGAGMVLAAPTFLSWIGLAGAAC